MPAETVNVVIAGLGGQGVLTASDVLARAAFHAGHDVKKSEVHGMSQRGGAVASDVRFGPRVLSPMVPLGEADHLVVVAEDQLAAFTHRLRPGPAPIVPSLLAGTPAEADAAGRNANCCLLGVLSRRLALPLEAWKRALDAALKPEHRAAAGAAFHRGRDCGR